MLSFRTQTQTVKPQITILVATSNVKVRPRNICKMLGRIGRRQVEMASQFLGSAAGFGGAAFCTLLYFTDWKVFVTYIPFYNGKFKDLPVEDEK